MKEKTQFAVKDGVSLPVKGKVFGKGYARCPHCKRGRIWIWDKECKVCKAKVVKL